MPRKTLVFTSFVREADEEIRAELERATLRAWESLRRGSKWKAMAAMSDMGISKVEAEILKTLQEKRFHPKTLRKIGFQDLAKSWRELRQGPIKDMFGNSKFRSLVIADIRSRLNFLASAVGSREESESGSEVDWEVRRIQSKLHREEQRRLVASIRHIGNLDPVATYTGNSDRQERDSAGDSFRSPLAPLMLVASNVGAEGIDLHTYCTHLVHFDLEWNPARMEQREGRADRLGRKLKEPINIYYALVKGTYDERMLHQLVVRQRWHSILLGKPAAKLARDEKGLAENRFINQETVRKLSKAQQIGIQKHNPKGF
jgi:ERCC4-related helicase